MALQARFDDFVALQQSILLLPAVEEKGIGAVVANEGQWKGFRLLALNETIRLHSLDLAEILATLREAPTPLVLTMERPSDNEAEDEKKTDEEEVVAVLVEETVEEPNVIASPIPEASMDDDKTAEPTEDLVSAEIDEPIESVDEGMADGASIPEESDDCAATEKDEPNAVPDDAPVHAEQSGDAEESATKPQSSSDGAAPETPVSNYGKALLSWTSRMRETSVQLAAMASATKSKTPVVEEEKPPRKRRGPLDMFVQTSTGAFLSVCDPNSLLVTNSSLLLVRMSVTQPCPAQGYEFQWYRSDGGKQRWKELDGATHSAFQPSATEVGYRLRCLVTQFNEDDEKVNEIELDTGIVQASSNLFNGARQALVRGAMFGGLVGKGPAQGRTFRVKVEMAKDGAIVTSALTIYQVSGSTAEAIHEAPLLGVSAKSDWTHSKELDIIFRGDHPSSLVSALSVDGRFRVEAPNRLARESLLLAIGIANYKGKPADLNASCMLFEAETASLLDDDDDDEEESIHSVDDRSIPDSTSVALSPTMMPQLPAMVTSPLPPRPMQAPNAEMTPPVPPRTLIPQRPQSVETYKRSLSFGSSPSREPELEKEVAELRAKLARKDKAISELQRHVTKSEAVQQKIQTRLEDKEAALGQSRTEKQEATQSLLRAEKRIQTLEDTLKRYKSDAAHREQNLQHEVKAHEGTIADLEKANRTLQNEKAVLSATVEARESKLGIMGELREELAAKNSQLKELAGLHRDLKESKDECDQLMKELGISKARVCSIVSELEASKQETTTVMQQFEQAQEKHKGCTILLEKQQMTIQKLKAERNSYKQKGDSLSKEMSRVCRQGRTIADVERILADDVTRRQEVVLLREQKKKALDEVTLYRNAYEQKLVAQQQAGVEHETRVLERNAELERLLTAMTEYVSAKEMQLETMKQVNEALQGELRELTKAQRSKHLKQNEI